MRRDLRSRWGSDNAFNSMRKSFAQVGSGALQIPTNQTSTQFKSLQRIRLGLPQADDLGNLSCACHTPGVLASDPWHAAWCQRQVPAGLLHTHTRVKRLLHKLCQSAHWHSRMEHTVKQTSYGNDGKKIPGLVVDLFITTPDKRIAVDVSTTCPAAPSLCGQAAREALHAANRRAGNKTTKYATACSEINASIVPFVFETTGALHGMAVTFMEELARAVAESSGRTFGDAYADLRRQLSSVILAGLATTFSLALVDARVHGRPTPPPPSPPQPPAAAAPPPPPTAGPLGGDPPTGPSASSASTRPGSADERMDVDGEASGNGRAPSLCPANAEESRAHPAPSSTPSAIAAQA